MTISHRRTGTRLYGIWKTMIARCHNQNARGYKDYGAKGIAVCERWRKFENFLEDMGDRPSDRHSLDRFPNKVGNYEPGNVRWATQKEQCRNTVSNKIVVYCGESRPLAEWSEILGFPYDVVKARLRYGWPAEVAFTKPLRSGRPLC